MSVFVPSVCKQNVGMWAAFSHESKQLGWSRLSGGHVFCNPNIKGLLILLQWQGCTSSGTLAGPGRPASLLCFRAQGGCPCAEGCHEGIASLVQGAHLSLSRNDRWRKAWRSLFLHHPPPLKGIFWHAWLFHPDIKKLCFIIFPSLPKALNTLVCQKTALL